MVSGRSRLRVASAWATVHPRDPPTPHGEPSEGTDSGLEVSSQESFTREWEVNGQNLHTPYRPEYDPMREENAFQIWAASNYPYGPDLDGLPFEAHRVS